MIVFIVLYFCNCCSITLIQITLSHLKHIYLKHNGCNSKTVEDNTCFSVLLNQDQYATVNRTLFALILRIKRYKFCDLPVPVAPITSIIIK